LAVAKFGRGPRGDRTFSFVNRNSSARGIRLPFADARLLDGGQGSVPELELFEAAVAGFKRGHPYLLFDKGATKRIRQRANRNPKLLARLENSLHEKNSAEARQDVRAAIKHRGRRLIHTSFLALISRGTTREDALQATRTALAGFAVETSWKARPVIKSFLDCAEIAVAVSLAYDWLYAEFSGEERQIIEESLFRHVLEPALAAYEDQFLLWPKQRDNCALVSNSGILIASLAVLERYPEASMQLIRKSLSLSSDILATLAPDGAWPEGLSYWSLAMRYAGLMVAALESTFGQSFGLADRRGFGQTGDFALHAVGPFGAAFNFGDSEPQFDISPLAWFAHRFKRPIDAWQVDSYDGWYLPFTVIWGDKPKPNSTAMRPPTGKVFHSGNLACFRNTWSRDPTARPVYVAVKGGNIPASSLRSPTQPEDTILHSQADAGSFIIDGARQRWIIDLGPDDYDLPGYFDHGADTRSGPRWQYYRTQAAGHNTLVIDGRNQIPTARAPIIGDCVDGGCKWAVFDLSGAYGRPAGSIRRGVCLVERQVLIQDEVGPDVGGAIVWSVHTSAEPVSIAGSVARFRSGDDRFLVHILEPETARFELDFPPVPRSFPIADVQQLHGRSLSTGEVTSISELPRRVDDNGRRAVGALIRRLQIVWPKGVRRLAVLFMPDYDGEALDLPVTPLNDWLAGRPEQRTSRIRPRYWARRGKQHDVGVALMGRPSVEADVPAPLLTDGDTRASVSL
jgi:Heparinase II/III-like protein